MIVAVVFGAAGTATAAGGDLLDRILQAETGCASICGPPAAAAEAAAAIERAGTALAPEIAALPDGRARVARLNRYVFEELGVRPAAELEEPANLLLPAVLAQKRGYCVGVASLYLALARRLDLPIRAVAAPSHLFLRYDDGAERFNIETLRGGATLSDEDYVREHRIPPRAVARGVYLRSLTDEEFLAQIHNNLGVLHSKRADPDAAAGEYERARRLDDRFPAPSYNEANDRLARKDPRGAIRLYGEALRLDPDDAWALNNRGLARLAVGSRRRARRDFEAALRVEPGFEAARRNLAALDAGEEPATR